MGSCQLILQEILYQSVITDRNIAVFPKRIKVCKKYRLQFSLWTLHKGGLQYTVVNKYCVFNDQTQVSLIFW